MRAVAAGRAWVQARWRPSFTPYDCIVLLLLGAIGIFVIAINYSQSYDDAYITYRYAENLATGHGFVYNLGEKYLGTTTPLYGALLGLLGALDPARIPTISGVLSGLSVLATAIALYCYARLYAKRFCGFLAALIYLTCPIVPAAFGGEMPLLVALVMWAFVAYAARRTGVATVLLALAILTRPDALLAALLLFSHYLATRRRLPVKELAIAAAMLVPSALFLWVASGSPLPGTLQSKLAQRDSGLWAGELFRNGAIELLKAYGVQGSSHLFFGIEAIPHVYRFALVLPLGAVAMLLHYRWWLLPIGWVAVYTTTYSIVNVPFYHWYIVPIVCGMAILAAAGFSILVDAVQWLFERWTHPTYERAALVLTALCVTTSLALAPGLRDTLNYERFHAAHWVGPRVQAYIAIGKWLDANAPPDATVGYLEIGFLGYYAHRTIIDPLGLVNRGLDPHVAERDLSWAYETYRPQYIVSYAAFSPQINGISTAYWFKREYRPVASFPSDTTQPIVIYQRTSLQRFDVTQLPPASTPAHGAIETVNGRGAAQYAGMPIPITRDQGLTVAGWAVDDRAGGPAGAISVTVDGKETRWGWYGRRQPDAVTGFPNSRDLNVGFWAYVPPSMLTKGMHTIEVEIVDSTLQSVASLQPVLTVNVQ